MTMIKASTFVVFIPLFLTRMVRSMAPPRFKDYENVYKYRKNRNITFDYHPTNIHPEFCRHMDESECRRRDAESAIRNPNEGNIKSIVLLLRFADHRDRDLPSKEYIDSLMNGGGAFPEVNKVGSVKEYLRYASMNKYNVEFTVTDWFDLPETEEYYVRNPDTGTMDSGRYCQKANMFGDALDYAMTQFDFEPYDAYGDPVTGYDGYLDSVVIIHSGFDAAYGEFYPFFENTCAPQDPTKRQWSVGCATTPFTSGGGSWINGFYSIRGWGMASAYSDCIGNYMTMGIVTHEIMHSLGLIDLYDMDPNPFPDGTLNYPGGVGLFDIMADPGGWNYDGSYPGSLSGYSRMKAGWLDPIPITLDGYYALQTAQFSSQVYMISQGFPDGEYILIENRQALKWEQDWPTGGYLIYRVDENNPGQFDRDNLRVRVEQADGKFEIEAGKSQDAGDFWTKGMTYGPGGGKPNSDSNNGQRTGISVTFLSDPNFIMQFRVEGLQGYGVPAFTPQKQENMMINESTEQDRFVPIRNSTAPGSTGADAASVETQSSVGETLAWIFSLLGGIGVLMGVAVVLL